MECGTAAVLIVHRGETAGALVGGLADVLATPPADPFTPEVLVVPTRGIERWIGQSLSILPAAGRPAPGITANVDFRFPARFFSDVVAAAEPDGIDRWDRSNLLWAILEILDDHLGDPTFAPVKAFVDGPDANRIVAADRIAGLFARYDHQFPAMLRAWASNQDTGPHDSDLDPTHRWQPILWRSLRRHLNTPCLAERIDDIGELLAAEPERLDLPDRVCLYGFTAVPEGQLTLLQAVASSRDVHLFALHPSDGAWTNPSTDRPRNSLLRSWGRDAERLRTLLGTLHVDDAVHHPSPTPQTTTLLGRIQSRIRADTEAADPTPLDPTDRSIQIHSCHGPRRQVEVARDAILHALASDPTLEPRDVVIMCPDVEAFAPLIEAAFHPDTSADGAGIPHIRIRVADRAPAAVNPLADLVMRVVALAKSRVTASEILEFLDLAPVRRRFRLDDDAVRDVAGLISELGIRWGFDADHRASHGLANRPELTWSAGLDRLAAGVFVADRQVGTLAGVMPLPGAESGDLTAASVFFEMTARFQAACTTITQPTTPAEWRRRLMEVGDMLGDTDWDTSWQRPALVADLERLLPDPPTGDGPRLGLDEIEVVLEDLSRTRASSTNHRSGDLTVCTLVPMRSVPHRVVCLVGMDDGRFPRNPIIDGDDLLGGVDAPGVRHAASEDRQLLLDALMAADERLIVTYSGRDERTNAPLPPAVPVAELLDEIVRAAGSEGSVVIEHPLQPFDPRNFTAGALVDGVWGFDRHMADGARALVAGTTEDEPLTFAEWEPPDVVDLADLHAFLQHPVQAFVLARMGVRLRERDEPRDDRLPLELNALGEWAVGDRLLAGELAGLNRVAVCEALAATGSLPVGALADGLVAKVSEEVDKVIARVDDEGLRRTPGEGVHVDVTVAGGTRVVGMVGDVTDLGIERISFSKAAPKRILRVWLDLIAATASVDRQLQAVIVGRGPYSMRWTSPPDPDTRASWAADRLATIVDLYLRAMSEPIPLFCETSYEYARGTEDYRVRGKWEGSAWRAGEAADLHHQIAFGGELSFAEICQLPPRDDEQGDGWPQGSSRFEVLARRLWSPILAAKVTNE